MRTREDAEKGIDLWNRYIRGEIPVRFIPFKIPENVTLYTIDLHGLTLNQAYDLTKSTILNTNYKKIKVITGSSGEIKRQFIFWMENQDISKYIKEVTPINNGSYFIFKKKKT